jgi:hypothetical protein
MKRPLIPLLFLILLTLTSAAAAQDGSPSPGWPVIERCLTPTPRPDGWTFEGTILLTGYAGIHGVNDAWPTPRVMAQFDGLTLEGGAGLSPDERWYARVTGYIIFTGTYNDEYIVEEIVVHSTINRNEVYRLPWQNWFLANWGEDKMYWVDNEHLLYVRKDIADGAGPYYSGESLVINPFDGTTVPWEGPATGILDVGDLWRISFSRVIDAQYVAPDLSRTVVPLGVRDTATNELLTGINIADEGYSNWMRDSSHFVTELDADPNEDSELRQLALYDRDGNLIDVLMTFEEGSWLSATTEAWSSDGRYLAFKIVNRNDYSNYGLFVADLNERQITKSVYGKIIIGPSDGS